MIIDAHNHPDWHGHTLESTIKNMDMYNIDKTWLLSWESPEGEYDPQTTKVLCGPVLSYNVPNAFAQCVEYKKAYPERFILGYAPDPRSADALDKLKSAVKHYDVKICGEIKYRMMYDNPDAVDMFKFCGEAKLPVTLHFDYATAQLTGKDYPRRHWWYGGGIDTLERVLELCPNTDFLGHAPGFWGHISNDSLMYTDPYPSDPVIEGGKIEQLLEKYSNLYCDISSGSGCKALSRDLEYSYKLINKFPDRFLFARDNFLNQHKELIETLNLSKDVKELIYHGNAERLITE